MSKSSRAPIPVNVIAGSLGVGKTTTINHLLKQRPPDERWAVLVNEYGLIGLDAALMEGSDAGSGPAGVEIREVATSRISTPAGPLPASLPSIKAASRPMSPYSLTSTAQRSSGGRCFSR